MYGFSSPQELLETPFLLFASKEDTKNIETVREFVHGGYRTMNLETRDLDRDNHPRWFTGDVVGEVTNGNLIGIWGKQRVTTHIKTSEKERSEIRRVLSSRQYFLLQLLAEKYDLKTAAQVMNIAENTAHKHLARIMIKLDIHDRHRLVKFTRELGIGY